MKKFFTITLTILIIAAALAGIIWGSGYLYAILKPAAPEFPVEAAIKPAGSLLLAADTTISFDAVIPANRRIVEAYFHAPEGVTATARVNFKRTKWRWNKNVYRFQTSMRPLRTGEIKESRITVTVAPEEKFTIPVPEAVCENLASGAAGSELELAGPAIPDKAKKSITRYLVIGGAVIILLAAALILWLLLRRKRTLCRETPPWELAIGALENLRRNLDQGDISPVQAFVRLTDIVRNYLECRFSLPASRRTTPEFLAEVARNTSALPEKQKPFLAGFLHAADLIKFAGAAASSAEVVTAVDHAETLVRETTPQDNAIKQEES